MLLLTDWSFALLRHFTLFCGVLVLTFGACASSLMAPVRVWLLQRARALNLMGVAAELLYCPVCLGTHVSWVLALLGRAYLGVPEQDVVPFIVESVATLVIVRKALGIQPDTLQREIREAFGVEEAPRAR